MHNLNLKTLKCCYSERREAAVFLKHKTIYFFLGQHNTEVDVSGEAKC